MGTLVTALFFINTEVIDSKLEVRDKVCQSAGIQARK